MGCSSALLGPGCNLILIAERILPGTTVEDAELNAQCSPNDRDAAAPGCAEELRSGAATLGTSEKECTMGAEGASRRWRCAMAFIIVHLSEAESRSWATPAGRRPSPLSHCHCTTPSKPMPASHVQEVFHVGGCLCKTFAIVLLKGIHTLKLHWGSILILWICSGHEVRADL